MLLKDDKTGTITPTDGVFENLSDDDKVKVQLWVSVILGDFNGGDWKRAKAVWDDPGLWDYHENITDQRVAAWGFFDSKQRAYLKGDTRKYLDEDPRP